MKKSRPKTREKRATTSSANARRERTADTTPRAAKPAKRRLPVVCEPLPFRN